MVAFIGMALAMLLAPPLSAQAGSPDGSCTLSANLLSLPVSAPASVTGRRAADSTMAGSVTTRAQPAAVAPSIILRAAAHARSIRFGAQPEIRVRLCHGLDSVRVTERRNLPTPIVAGRVYQDVYIAMELLAHVDGACLADRILPRTAAVAAPPAAAGDTTRLPGATGAASVRCASLSLRSTAGSSGP
jgi:hypothetical protein